MADSEVRQKETRELEYDAFWRELTLKGDPLFVPNKFRTGFNAGFEAGMRAGEIAQQEKSERNYARGFDHAVRDIVAALGRQFNQELNEDRKLGLHIALNTASGYHGFMDAEKPVPAAPEEKNPLKGGTP